MLLKKLSLINFKNIAQADIAFDEGINCFAGDNGAGKTNIIDAAYYLSMCKSAFAMTDNQSVRHGEDFFVIEGDYRTDGGGSEHINCSYIRRSGKVIKRNGKEYERLSDHVGLLPVTVVSPADSVLIDASDERRRLLNAFVSQLDRDYLHALVRYNSVLAERNRCLKQMADESLLEIYDAQICEPSRRIHSTRTDIICRLQPLVAKYYAALSDDSEQVEITYKSELNDTPIEELLARSRQRDIYNQFTSVGVHRDDMTFEIGGYPLRRYGSQGQQKSFLIALKLAQYAIASQTRGERPLLLLDDLFDKLDMNRVRRLLEIVSGDEFGQILITDCNSTRLRSLLDEAAPRYKLYTVREGEVTL